MRIGELAAAAGIKVTTIRFYEGERLLAPPARTAANYRSYPPGAVQRVQFIRRAQQLGFSLTEIRDFLGASDAVEGRALRAYAAAKLDDLAGRVRDLQRMQRGIRRLIARGRVDGPCPILEALAPCPPA